MNIKTNTTRSLDRIHIRSGLLEVSQSFSVILLSLQRMSNIVEQLSIVLVYFQTRHENAELRSPVSHNNHTAHMTQNYKNTNF